MSAYLGFTARPTGFTADATSLRALSLDQVAAGQKVQFTDVGGLQFWVVRWDPAETAADDGQQFFIPDSVTFPAPGRWVTEGATLNLPNTYVLRDGTGAAIVEHTAPLTVALETVAPNTAPNFLFLDHTTSDGGNGAVGIGAGIAIRAESSAGSLAFAAQIVASLTLANGNASKIDFYASSGGLFGVRASVDGADFKVPGGVVFSAARFDTLTAVPLQLGPNCTSHVLDSTTGVTTLKLASSTIGAVGPSGGYLQFTNANVAGVNTGVDFFATVGDAQLRTPAGAVVVNGNTGPTTVYVGGVAKLTVAAAVATFATDVAFGGNDLTGVLTVSNATGSLTVTSGSGHLTLDSDSGSEVRVGTSTTGGFSAGHSGKLVTLTSGGERHTLDDDVKIISQWGANGFTEERRKSVTTVNATPVVAFTFSIPSSASGTAVLRVDSVDATNGERASYERTYCFSRRSAGTSNFAAVGADVVYEDDASWDASVTHSSPTLSASVTGDASNQTQHDVQLVVKYQTFTPV